MLPERASGILLHPTSLPGPHGAGDLGIEAHQFVDWLAKAGQKVWQMLPLGPVGDGNSPYMGSSAFAGNPLLIDLRELLRLGWLDAEELAPPASFAGTRIDFPTQFAWRMPRLRSAAGRFFANASADQRADFATFCTEAAEWLDDYALFMTLEAAHPGCCWVDWPRPLARRQARALAQFASEHADEIAFAQFCQWCFARQWQALRAHAHARGVKIMGDVPIFVAHHSADVWAHQKLFELDGEGRQTVVAGVPPDYFSASGQRWGNPLYRWSRHRATGFAWWLARIKRALELADLVRIDHFRGFAAYWEIPASEVSAINGRWVKAPGAALFAALREAFPDLPIVAEDLGTITSDVEALRDQFGLPGMRILQFAFSEDADHAYLPHNYVSNCVAYSGTHDNDTSIGWWRTLDAHQRSFVQHYLGTDGAAIHWSLIRALSASVAKLVIYPMQDVLELDGFHRMNVPGTGSGNWEWRFAWHQVQAWQAKVLREMGAVHGRCDFAGVTLPP